MFATRPVLNPRHDRGLEEIRRARARRVIQVRCDPTLVANPGANRLGDDLRDMESPAQTSHVATRTAWESRTNVWRPILLTAARMCGTRRTRAEASARGSQLERSPVRWSSPHGGPIGGAGQEPVRLIESNRGRSSAIGHHAQFQRVGAIVAGANREVQWTPCDLSRRTAAHRLARMDDVLDLFLASPDEQRSKNSSAISSPATPRRSSGASSRAGSAPPAATLTMCARR